MCGGTSTTNWAARRRASTPTRAPRATEYDELDRPVAAWDGRNKKTSTVYDKLGRTQSTWQGDADTGTKLSETRYDKAGWLGQAYAFFNYISPTESFATAVQSMDEFYRPLKTAYQVPASQGATGRHVRLLHRVQPGRHGPGRAACPPSRICRPEALVYTYDALQRPTTMTGTYPVCHQHRLLQRTVSVQQFELFHGNGKKVQQTFDYETGTDRLTRSVVDVVGTTVAKESNYSYDQAGNVLSISDTANRPRRTSSASPTTAGSDCPTHGLRRSTAATRGRQRHHGLYRPGGRHRAHGMRVRGRFERARRPGPVLEVVRPPTPSATASPRSAHDTGLDAAKNITRSYDLRWRRRAGRRTAPGHQGRREDPDRVTAVRRTSTTTRAAPPSGPSAATPSPWTGTHSGKLAEVTEANGSKTSYLYDASGSRALCARIPPARPSTCRASSSSCRRTAPRRKRPATTRTPVRPSRSATDGEGLLPRLRPPRHGRAGDRLRHGRDLPAALRPLRRRARRRHRHLAGGEGLRRRHDRRLYRPDPSGGAGIRPDHRQVHLGRPDHRLHQTAADQRLRLRRQHAGHAVPTRRGLESRFPYSWSARVPSGTYRRRPAARRSTLRSPRSTRPPRTWRRRRDSSPSPSSASSRQARHSSRPPASTDLLDTELEKLHRLSQDQTALTGVRSGYTKLDELTGGFQNGNLVVIAARPSMGKSALVTNMAENAAIQHGGRRRPVQPRDVRGRARPALHRLTGQHQGRGAAQGPRRRAALAEDPAGLPAAPRTRRCTSTTPAATGLLEIRAKARRLALPQPDLGLIIVDYLQLHARR